MSSIERANDSTAVSRRTFFGQGLLTAIGGAHLGMMPVSASSAETSATIVDQDITQSVGRSQLTMLLQGKSASECRAWQTEFRKTLNALLGSSAPPKKWGVTEENRTEFDDHVRHDMLLEADGVPSVPVYLLVPQGLTVGGKAPGVLCIHGHGQFGNHPIVGRRDLEGVADNIKRHNYDYGLQFVRRGYVVAAPCMIPFGRRVDREAYRGNDPCAVTFVRMQAMGKLPITANLRDLRWCLDLLQSRAEVHADRIGCGGLSYGGRMTMMVSAIDQRIKVACVSGALNLLQERMTLRHSCGSQMIPGLLKYGDYSEIGSLIAPRPCVWETGSTDGLIVPKWDEVFRSRLRRAYQALDAADQLHFDKFAGGHVWSGRIAIPLFDRVLKV